MADLPQQPAPDAPDPSIQDRMTAYLARDNATKQHKAQPRTAPEAPVQVETKPQVPEPDEPVDEGEPLEPEAPETEEQEPDLELDAEQEDAPPETWKIKHEGREVELTRDQLIEHAQQGFDYQRKAQVAVESTRATHEILKGLQSLQTAAPQLVQELASVRSIQAEMQNWQNVNWVQLAQQVDGQTYNSYRAYYDGLQQRFQQASATYQQKAKAMDDAQARAIDQLTDVEARKLPDLVPEFRNPEKAARVSKDIEQYLLKRGVPEFLVKDLRFASVIAVAYDGLRYQQMRAKQSTQSSVANKQLRNAPPLTKPQASQSRQASAQRDYAKQRAELKKSGDVNTAGALLARLMK
jgi:hypothetical protein